MLTLIAESKTMTACDSPLSEENLALHTPSGLIPAEEIMHHMASLSPAELSSIAKFSGTMAVKAIRLAMEFPNRTLGSKAIEAFTGVVFKSLDYPSLDSEAKGRIDSDVRFISSLYGWLRPDDIVKAYRLDYTTPLAPGHLPMVRFWKKDVTIALVKEIKERGGDSIINLLPGDAAKAVDWKLVKKFAQVWKVDFKELCDGGLWRTPSSNRLKELRGHLLREIALRGIDSPSQLLTLETDRLSPLGTPDFPDHICFGV